MVIKDYWHKLHKKVGQKLVGSAVSQEWICRCGGSNTTKHFFCHYCGKSNIVKSNNRGVKDIPLVVR